MKDNKLVPTENHKTYELMLNDRENLPVVVTGPAGTSKTYTAAKRAVSWMEQSNKHICVVIRPNVPYADTLGFEKGSVRDKISHWIRPIEECFIAHGLCRSTQEIYEKNNRLEFVALEHAQGRTWDNAFIFIDEAENMTIGQLKGVLTRVGRHSKIVIAGDVAQTSTKFKKSGLAELRAMVKELNLPVHTLEFTPDDILRSETVKQMILAFDKWDEMKIQNMTDFK